MPFALYLRFDRDADASVRKLGRDLERHGVPSLFSRPDMSPHVTLAVFEEVDTTRLLPRLKKLAASFAPLPLNLSSLGSFPGAEGVLFLAPLVTPDLLRLHTGLHRSLKGLTQGLWDHYLPGKWVPHCTMGIHLRPKTLLKGFQVLRERNYAISGRSKRLVLVEFHPIQEIFSVPFSGKK